MTAIELPKRQSVTFQAAAERCMLAAQLKRDFDQVGEPAIVGRAFHEVAAAVAVYARYKMLDTVEPDVGDQIAAHVLANPDEPDPLPLHAISEVRDLVRKWLAGYVFPVHDEVYEVEKLAVHELVGQKLSARLDLQAITGTVAQIDDYKTGWNIPTSDEIQRDPAHRAGLQKYAWHVAQDYPYVSDFHLRLIFPRQRQVREVEITREEVERTHRDLVITTSRIKRAYESGYLSADPGSHCKNCPAPDRCPRGDEKLPDVIETQEQAEHALGTVLALSARVQQGKGGIREYLERTGDQYIEVGGERLGFFGGGETVKIDKAKLEKAGLLPFYSTKSQEKPSFTTRKAR